VFNDRALLDTIYNDEVIVINGVGGGLRSSGYGYFCGYKVYYCPDCPENLLSEGYFEESGCRIDIVNRVRHVYSPDGTLLVTAAYNQRLLQVKFLAAATAQVFVASATSLPTAQVLDFLPPPPAPEVIKIPFLEKVLRLRAGDESARLLPTIEGFDDSATIAHQQQRAVWATTMIPTATSAEIPADDPTDGYSDGHSDDEDSPEADVTAHSTISDAIAPVLAYPVAANKASRAVIELHNALNKPTLEVFRALIKKDYITNSGLKVDDIAQAESMLDPDRVRQLAKTTRADHDESRGPGATAVGDRLYADLITDPLGNRYLLVIDRFSGFGTSVWILNKATPTLMDAFKKVIRVYTKHGHRVAAITTDSEPCFVGCIDRFAELGIPMTTTPAGQHCPIIERYVRTIKEEVVILKASLNYAWPPGLEVFTIAYAVFLRNLMPRDAGTPPPASQVFKRAFDIRFMSLLQFGQPVALHVEESLRRGPFVGTRSTYAIYVGKSYNTPSACKFYIPAQRSTVVWRARVVKLDAPPSCLEDATESDFRIKSQRCSCSTRPRTHRSGSRG
jgi:hypothetical protein